MDRPFRRFCFVLAEKLGMSVKQVLALESAEITEWMSYCLTQNEKWIEEFKKEKELEAFNELTPEEKAAHYKKAFGVKK